MSTKTPRNVSASVLADLHSFEATYKIRTFDDDPNVDLELVINLGQQCSVDIEMTEAEAEQLATDLLGMIEAESHVAAE